MSIFITIPDSIKKEDEVQYMIDTYKISRNDAEIVFRLSHEDDEVVNE